MLLFLFRLGLQRKILQNMELCMKNLDFKLHCKFLTGDKPDRISVLTCVLMFYNTSWLCFSTIYVCVCARIHYFVISKHATSITDCYSHSSRAWHIDCLFDSHLRSKSSGIVKESHFQRRQLSCRLITIWHDLQLCGVFSKIMARQI